MEKSLQCDSTVDQYLLHSIRSKAAYWKQILHRVLDVILFLGERGLAFRGDNQLIGDSRNGNFLGILELISHYNPILEEHLNKVKTSQNSKCRLQVHYLSPESQNEFIKCCADKVTECILKERETAKYYSIIVDATPDSSHIEQTVFVLHYVHLNAESDNYLVLQRFLEFVDCKKKNWRGNCTVDS